MENPFSFIADIIGIVSAIFSLLAWQQARQIHQQIELEKQRQNKRVQVVLRYGAEDIQLPVELRRAETTRAEILGRLGMIPMKERGKRFSLDYLNTPEFLRRLNEIIQGGEDTVLTIPCTRDEFEQFDLKR